MRRKIIKSVGCFVEYNEKILVLLRSSHKHEGKTWGLPAGAIKKGEAKEKALGRKLIDEIGLDISQYEHEYIGDIELRYKNFDTIFSTYKLKIDKEIDIKLNNEEHSEYRWVNPEFCYKSLNCMRGLYTLLEKVYLEK